MSETTVYAALIAGYASAIVFLVAAARWNQSLWPRVESIPRGLPLRYTALSLALVLIIGQLFSGGWLLPANGRLEVFARTANQFLIFAPVFAIGAIALVRGDDRARRIALLPGDQVHWRIGFGILAALIAMSAYHTIAQPPRTLLTTFINLFNTDNIPHLVQILGEDIAIGLLVASLLTKVRPRTAIVATGLLFALGHVPAMLTHGQALRDFLHLIADGLLAAGMVALLLRLRDLWVIWPVHVAMDLMQFQ